MALAVHWTGLKWSLKWSYEYFSSADLWGIFWRKMVLNQDHFKTTITLPYSSKRPFERHSCLWFLLVTSA
jgi:hypothetical protein